MPHSLMSHFSKTSYQIMSFLLMTHEDFQVILGEYKAHHLDLLVH